MAYEQEAKRFVEALTPKPEAGLTIKLTSAVIKSVGANHSTAEVDTGTARLRVLNKSGEKLVAGESVWLVYTKTIADAVIWWRCGYSIPVGGEDDE